MAKVLTCELEAAKARALRNEVEGRPEFLDSETGRWRVWDESRDPAFNLLPPNTLPETRRERAEARAKLSAASRVRDRGEVDLCHGTGKYLGVACPGCGACGEGNAQSS